jgi:hypothetical protein
VTDLFSRYLICCDGYPSTSWEPVKGAWNGPFESGLPEAIRTDNGAPFASTGIARLTRLGVWLLKLGVTRELIQPGKPSQNGRHERMHKTLKDEATKLPSATLKAQQKRFDVFQSEFNDDRPHEDRHEATGGAVRAFTEAVPRARAGPRVPRALRGATGEPQRRRAVEERLVERGARLIEENVGMEEVDDGVWSVFFGALIIGRFDEKEMRLVGTFSTHYRSGKRGDRDRTTPPGPPQ